MCENNSHFQEIDLWTKKALGKNQSTFFNPSLRLGGELWPLVLNFDLTGERLPLRSPLRANMLNSLKERRGEPHWGPNPKRMSFKKDSEQFV
jgi:hypothetical protein